MFFKYTNLNFTILPFNLTISYKIICDLSLTVCAFCDPLVTFVFSIFSNPWTVKVSSYQYPSLTLTKLCKIQQALIIFWAKSSFTFNGRWKILHLLERISKCTLYSLYIYEHSTADSWKFFLSRLNFFHHMVALYFPIIQTLRHLLLHMALVLSLTLKSVWVRNIQRITYHFFYRT